MKKTYRFGTIVVCASALFIAGCGGSGSSSTTTAGTTTGVADVSSLQTVPSTDLSTIDSSLTTSSANLAVLTKSADTAKSAHTTGKSLGEDFDAVGNSSRAGCEANMHKKEMFRMGQEIQLERCYPEAMEAAGLITIPSGSRALYKITTPEHDDTEQGQRCDGIPSEDTDRRAACDAGEGPSGENLLLRIGVIDGALQIDLCSGATGSEALESEATYSGSGTVYSATATRIGSWLGSDEKTTMTQSVDIGADGSVADGQVTLGTGGTASATAEMSGGFGNGNMTFSRTGTTNTIKGTFNGDFVDPFTDARSQFTGKVYSEFGGSGNTGCAKFSFTGTMPPMRVQDMVPFNIGPNDLNNFLQALGAELGIILNSTNYTTTELCPNPDFDPDSSSNEDSNGNPIKSMVAASNGTCGSVTHNDVECFGISNGTVTGDLGNSVTQSFTIIANTATDFFTDVNAFDLSTLATPDATGIAFTRNWDCTGTFTTIDFSTFTAAQLAAVDTEMDECFALEEKLFGEGGMGDHNCHQQENSGNVQKFAENGGPGFGLYGGDYNSAGTGTCFDDQNAAALMPSHLFVDSITGGSGDYCFPSEGGCEKFTAASNTLTGLSITPIPGNSDMSITGITYTQSGSSPATAATITWSITSLNGSCAANYTIGQPSFTGPGDFGGEGTGDAPGEAGFVPQPCINAGFTAESEQEACHQLCRDPSVNCRPS